MTDEDVCKQCGAIYEPDGSYDLDLKRSALDVDTPDIYLGDSMALCPSCKKELRQLFQAWLENDSGLRSLMGCIAGWQIQGHEARTLQDLLENWRMTWEQKRIAWEQRPKA